LPANLYYPKKKSALIESSQFLKFQMSHRQSIINQLFQ
jgi:hypothetical protein